MRNYLALAFLSIFLCALGTPASQHDSHKNDGHQSLVDPGWPELNSSIEKMHRSMATVGPSGNSDVDFVNLMLPHHQAAIEMAKTELLHGKDPEVRRLAQEIITDQQSEMDVMQLWLKQQNPNHQK